MILLATLAACLAWSSASAALERYSYDLAGRLVNVLYADGTLVRYHYDANSNIESVEVTTDEIFAGGFE